MTERLPTYKHEWMVVRTEPSTMFAQRDEAVGSRDGHGMCPIDSPGVGKFDLVLDRDVAIDEVCKATTHLGKYQR